MTDHWIPSKMADELRKAHAERLQAARDGVDARLDQLTTLRLMGAAELALVSALIDAKVELALLERGGG